MQVDERLRRDLTRIAYTIQPDVDHHLEEITRRARRGQRQKALVRVGAVAAAIVTVFVLSLTTLPDRRQGVASGSLSGTYVTTIEPGNAILDESGLAGRWSLRFDPAGVIDVTAPPAYRGVLSAVLYREAGDSFRTNLFEQDLCSGHGLGTYAWHVNGDALRFTVFGDTCAERVALLTSHVWSEQP